MTCPSCGERNPEGIDSCPHCGLGFDPWAATKIGPLPVAEATATAEVPGSPTVIAGRYELREMIGRGGAGVVYRARDRELDDDIAIKMLMAQSSRDAGEVERFKREIVTARRISHPNVIRIHEFGMSGGEAFISMELLRGGSLADRIEKGPLPLDEAVEIGIAVAEGLAAAHETGIVHRDVKPGNILFDRNGRPKLVDFGLARLLDSTTRTVGFSGTPFYMSPEQADGREATSASDVYSLGVVLFEMLTGVLPFRADSLLKLAMMHTSEPAPSPRHHRSDLPEALEAIVLRCLEKETARRPVDAGELASWLREWKTTRRVRLPASDTVIAARPLTRTVTAEALELPVALEAERAPPPRRARRLATIALFAVAGGGAAFAAAQVVERRNPVIVKRAPTPRSPYSTTRPTPARTPTETPREIPPTPLLAVADTPQAVAVETVKAAPTAKPWGRLTVRALPWADVLIDDATSAANSGGLPLEAYRLPAGPHRLRLRYGSLERAITVDVRPNHTLILQVNMETKKVLELKHEPIRS